MLKTFYFTHTGNVVAFIDANPAYSSPRDAQSISVDNTYTPDAWEYWTVTYNNNGDRKAHIYKNGIEVTYVSQTAATATLIDDTGNPMYFGATADSAFYEFNGLIDDIRIYNRVLTLSEIQSLANIPTFGKPPLWVQNVPDGGSFTDPIGGGSWGFDSSNGYLFTAVVADHEYVYTGRAWYGPWSGSGGGTIQRWDAHTGELLASVPTCGCDGVYSMELKDDGTGTVRLYVYKVNGIEIFDRLTLASVGGSGTPDPSTPLSSGDPAVAQKRIANRNDGVSMKVQHYYGSIGTYSSPGSGQLGQQNTLGLYQNNSNWGFTLEYNDPSWVTNVVPAPTTVAQQYFGAENIALSPAGDYMYITGGNKSGGVYSSRLEKIELDMPPNPDAAISSTPVQVMSGGNITLSWASHYADYCDISSTGVGGWTNLPTSGYKYNVGPINDDTTFTVTCTRNSDSTTATDSVLVTLARPTAIVTTPSGNIAVAPTDVVNFDGTASHDAVGGSVSVYEWREGNCDTGTLLSNGGTFNQTFSLGSNSVYLRVRDSGGLWSTNCPLRIITVPPQCSDGMDNDGDMLKDDADPGCWTDPANPATYDARDNNESNCGNGICEQVYGETTKTCVADCKVLFKNF